MKADVTISVAFAARGRAASHALSGAVRSWRRSPTPPAGGGLPADQPLGPEPQRQRDGDAGNANGDVERAGSCHGFPGSSPATGAAAK